MSVLMKKIWAYLIPLPVPAVSWPLTGVYERPPRPTGAGSAYPHQGHYTLDDPG